MADPRKLLEKALYDALSAALGATVYNTRATGASAFGYVLLSHAGGDDQWRVMKHPLHVLEYEIVAVDTDREDALELAGDVDDAVAALDRALTVAGYAPGEVTRASAVDKTEVMQNGQPLYSVGGRWRFELWEV